VYDEESGVVAHLGAAYSYNRPAGGIHRVRAIPEFGFSFGDVNANPLGGPFFIDTGPLATNSFNLYGLEGAYTRGGFSTQGELMLMSVDQMAGPRAQLSGGYIQFGQILTGESRPYKLKTAVLGGVTPDRPFGKEGFGALEAAVRYSFMDLNDQNVAGGRLYNFTAGLNWYLNAVTKVQFNYIRSLLADPTFGNSLAHIFAMRLQLSF
jgi:phosphate-selective porin OprO/OprP